MDVEQIEQESAWKRRQRAREALLAKSNYAIGEKVLVRGQLGRIVFYIPEGKTVWKSWEIYSNLEPEAVKATADSFYAKERLSTHRYFVELEVLGRPRIFCPYLHNIERLDS